MLECKKKGESMSSVKDKIRFVVTGSRLYKDFSNLTDQLLRNQSDEAVESANKIIEGQVEELVEELFLLMKDEEQKA